MTMEQELAQQHKIKAMYAAHPEMQTMYTMLKQMGVDIKETALVNEAEKHPFVSNDETVRTVQGDIDYMLQSGIGKIKREQLNPNGARWTKNMAEDVAYAHENRLENTIHALQSGKMFYVDNEGNIHNGLGVVEDIMRINNGREEKINMDALVGKCTTEDGFDFNEYDKFYHFICEYKEELTAKDFNALIDSYETPEYADTWMAKKTKAEQTRVAKIELENTKIFATIDEIILNDASETFEAIDINSESFTASFTPEEQAEYDAMVEKIKDSAPLDLPDNKINEWAHERLCSTIKERISPTLAKLDKADETTRKFLTVIEDVEARKTINEKLIEAYENTGMLKQNNTKAAMAYSKFFYMVHRGLDEIQRQAAEHLLKVPASLYTKTLAHSYNHQQVCMEKQLELQHKTQEKIMLLQARYLKEPEKFHPLIKATISVYEHFAEKAENSAKKYYVNMIALENKSLAIEDKYNELLSRDNSKNYLETAVFVDNFSKEERKLLAEFSLVAKKNFTLKEATELMSCYAASEGKLTPAYLLQNAKLNSQELLAGAIQQDELITHFDFMDSFKRVAIEREIMGEITAKFGPNRMILGLPREQQEFLLEQKEKGVPDKLLMSEALNFKNGGENYTVEYARENIDAAMRNAKDIPIPEAVYQKMHENKFETPLKQLGETAKTLNQTLRTTYLDEKTQKEYTLISAKNGCNFMLKEKDLITGQESPYIRSTTKINDILSKQVGLGRGIEKSQQELLYKEIEKVEHQKQEQKDKRRFGHENMKKKDEQGLER